MIYNKDKKFLEPPISGADNYLRHIKASLPLPEQVIMCPVSMLNKIIKNNFASTFYRLDGDIYVLNAHGVAFVTNFGMGSPAFAMMAEVLIGLGVKNIILTGIAGSLQKNLKAGDIVLCEKALRDEGVSSSYIAPADFALPSASLTTKIKEALTQKNAPFSYGPTWTTDVLFRETAAEITAYQQAGIMTVEMEAAAAFAIAQHYKVNCAAIFAISDQLANLKWEPHFGEPEIDAGMKTILDVCLEALKTEK